MNEGTAALWRGGSFFADIVNIHNLLDKYRCLCYNVDT